MFNGNNNLEYINLQNFNESKITTNKDHYKDIFAKIPENVVICINEENNLEKILPQIRNISCYTIDCSDNWKLKQKKIIYETAQCIENCQNNEKYKYEYNNKCYQNCSQGYLFYDNNKCKCELD